jgi:hypothetical protein
MLFSAGRKTARLEDNVKYITLGLLAVTPLLAQGPSSPEPATIGLAGIGIAVMGYIAYRRNRK